MKRLLMFLCATALFFGVVGSVEATLLNGDFEKGDLTGWNYSGDVSVDTSFTIGGQTYYPTEGNYLAKVGLNSALWYNSLLKDGGMDIIIMPSSNVDLRVRARTGDGSNISYSMNVLNSESFAQTIQTGTITFDVPNDWCIFVEGVNVGQGIPVLIDNLWGDLCPGTNPVPEPATMLLFGAGIAGLGVFRKKFKKA